MANLYKVRGFKIKQLRAKREQIKRLTNEINGLKSEIGRLNIKIEQSEAV